MLRTEKKAEILSDLLRINKDCSTIYQGIIENHTSRVSKLSPFLQGLVNLERACMLELRRQVDTSYGDPADAVEIRGEIYLARQEGGGSKSPTREKELFAYCERRLKELHQAYDTALQFSNEFSDQVRMILQQQAVRVKESFDSIRKYRMNQRQLQQPVP